MKGNAEVSGHGTDFDSSISCWSLNLISRIKWGFWRVHWIPEDLLAAHKLWSAHRAFRIVTVHGKNARMLTSQSSKASPVTWLCKREQIGDFQVSTQIGVDTQINRIFNLKKKKKAWVIYIIGKFVKQENKKRAWRINARAKGKNTRTDKTELLRTWHVPQGCPEPEEDIKVGFPFDSYPPTTNHQPGVSLPAPHILTLQLSSFILLSSALFLLLCFHFSHSLTVLSSLSFSVLSHLPWGRAITYPVSPNFVFLSDMKFLSAFIDASKCYQPSSGLERPFGIPIKRIMY